MDLGEILAVHHCQGRRGILAAGYAAQDIGTACGEHLQLGLLGQLHIHDGLDGGNLSLIIALERGIDGHGSLLGGGVPVGDHISAGEGILRQVIAVRLNLCRLHIAVPVLLIEALA